MHVVAGHQGADDTGRATRVLVIDDEPELRRFLAIMLRSQGYVVELAGTGHAGLQALAQRGADLVILDMLLPDADGKAVLRDLRKRSSAPVIMLTVRGDENEKVAALDLGATDYVTKPFGVQELLARVRAHLRRQKTVVSADAILDDGFLRVDLGQGRVTLGGQPVTLTRKEYALLALLARHAGEVVSHSFLLRELWGPTYEQDTHYLRILVGRLRLKLGDEATNPRWIITEPRLGLRLALSPLPAP